MRARPRLGSLTRPEGAEYAHPAVREEIPEAALEAVRAGAEPPLRYIGSGMTGNVIGDRRRHCFKVPRGPYAAEIIAVEAEFFRDANRVPAIRRNVARFIALHPSGVLERECVEAKPVPRSAYTRAHRQYDQMCREIWAAMIPHGWTAPECKEDSFVIARGRGPVLVDGSSASRVGQNLVRYVQDVLAQRRRLRAHERPRDLAYLLRREIVEGTVPPGPGCALLTRLKTVGADEFTDCPTADEIARLRAAGGARAGPERHVGSWRRAEREKEEREQWARRAETRRLRREERRR